MLYLCNRSVIFLGHTMMQWLQCRCREKSCCRDGMKWNNVNEKIGYSTFSHSFNLLKIHYLSVSSLVTITVFHSNETIYLMFVYVMYGKVWLSFIIDFAWWKCILLLKNDDERGDLATCCISYTFDLAASTYTFRVWHMYSVVQRRFTYFIYCCIFTNIECLILDNILNWFIFAMQCMLTSSSTPCCCTTLWNESLWQPIYKRQIIFPQLTVVEVYYAIFSNESDGDEKPRGLGTYWVTRLAWVIWVIENS